MSEVTERRSSKPIKRMTKGELIHWLQSKGEHLPSSQRKEFYLNRALEISEPEAYTFEMKPSFRTSPSRPSWLKSPTRLTVPLLIILFGALGYYYYVKRFQQQKRGAWFL